MGPKSRNRSKHSSSTKPDSEQKSANNKSLILTFPGPNQTSNFAFWVELLEQKSLLDYGNLGRMYKLDKYYEPPEVKYDINDLSAAKDPLGMARKAVESQIINRSKEMSEMERNRTPMFALIRPPEDGTRPWLASDRRLEGSSISLQSRRENSFDISVNWQNCG